MIHKVYSKQMVVGVFLLLHSPNVVEVIILPIT